MLYIEADGALVVMASNFGQPRHPAWSANLIANPDAEVVVQGEQRKVRARLATDQEKAELWPRLVEVYPTWEAYREARTAASELSSSSRSSCGCVRPPGGASANQ